MSFIEVTSHGDKNIVLVAVAKICLIMPVPEIEVLAHGRATIILENGIRINVSESREDIRKLISPPIH